MFNPNLVLRGGSLIETAYLLAYCIIGIAILAGGLEGYLIGFGRIANWARPLLILAGLLFAYPDPWKTAAIGAVITLLALGFSRVLANPNVTDRPAASSSAVAPGGETPSQALDRA